MKPIQLTPEQRKEIDRRRKASHDRRLYQRLTAVLAVAAGRTRAEVADLLGVRLTQLGEWLRIVTVHPTSGNGLFRAVKSRFLRR